tara:strand:+ start:178 stop:840 length:663 start_codon:yes stop_codon:yes gene_type:complete
MTLRLNGSSSGFTEINAPAAAGSNTLVLPTSNGSANQYLKNGSTAGTLEFGALDRVKRTYSSQLSVTSGDTELEFTGIPANCSRLTLVYRKISLSGSNNVLVQIGDSSSYKTSGYVSHACFLGTSSLNGGSSSAGYMIRGNSTTVEHAGYMTLVPSKLSTPAHWSAFHSGINQASDNTRIGSGLSPALTADITRIKMVPSGSNTFDDADGRILLITEVIE